MTDLARRTGAIDNAFLERIGTDRLKEFGSHLISQGVRPENWGGLPNSGHSAWVNALTLSDRELHHYGVGSYLITVINTEWKKLLRELEIE